MYIINSLLTKYCQLFGYSSCTNLTVVDTFFLAAGGLLVILSLVRHQRPEFG